MDQACRPRLGSVVEKRASRNLAPRMPYCWEFLGNNNCSYGVQYIVPPPIFPQAGRMTVLTQMRKPRKVIVLILLYPFVVAGLIWFVIALFWGAPFFSAAAGIAFVSGNILMSVLLIYYRHKTRHQWINAEAAKWLRSRARHRGGRKAVRLLLLLPSVFALWVLSFLPLATHVIVHPSSRYLPNFRIPIPWTWIALSVCVGDNCWADAVISSKGRGRFGATPFWPTAQLSVVTFGTMRGEYYNASDWRPRGVGQVTTMALKLGDMPLTCWQYLAQMDLYDRYLIGLPAEVPAWRVVCANRVFYAHFFGRAEDLPAFYGVLQRVVPIDNQA
jgi:hypothetical protein